MSRIWLPRHLNAIMFGPGLVGVGGGAGVYMDLWSYCCELSDIYRYWEAQYVAGWVRCSHILRDYADSFTRQILMKCRV